MRIIERVAEHYDVQEVEFGRVYTWCPDSVVVECACGEESTFKSSELLSGSVSICECGKDRMDGIREELQDEVVGCRFEGDEGVHPWRYAGYREGFGLPY